MLTIKSKVHSKVTTINDLKAGDLFRLRDEPSAIGIICLDCSNQHGEIKGYVWLHTSVYISQPHLLSREIIKVKQISPLEVEDE